MKRFETICVHPLKDEDKIRGEVAAAIFPSVAYNYLGKEDLEYPGFYSTYNQKRLGLVMAKLERGQWGMVFSSGMAAISTAIFSFVQQGDHIIFSRDLYGGTWKLAEQELPKRGVAISYADNTAESFRSKLQPNTKIIYVETPANPLLNIVPLKEVSTLAKGRGIITVVDNTFASPINQLPLLHGINISIHSGTKYLGGHNDLPFGALISNHEDHRGPIFNTAKLYGGSLSAEQCYLVERSLKTLAIRVSRQNKNALSLAKYLSHHPAVQKVYYPGLTTHLDYKIASEQMSGFGGMLSFELAYGPEDIRRFLKGLRIIQPALSLGGVESLICSPAVTSHKGLTASEREHLGIKDNLLRLSAGIESVEDLIEDIEQSISRI